jgi:hypothetical protein
MDEEGEDDDEEESVVGLPAVPPRRKPLARTQKRNLDESAPFDRSSPLKILAIRSDLRREIVLVLAASPYVCNNNNNNRKKKKTRRTFR